MQHMAKVNGKMRRFKKNPVYGTVVLLSGRIIDNESTVLYGSKWEGDLLAGYLIELKPIKRIRKGRNIEIVQNQANESEIHYLTADQIIESNIHYPTEDQFTKLNVADEVKHIINDSINNHDIEKIDISSDKEDNNGKISRRIRRSSR